MLKIGTICDFCEQPIQEDENNIVQLNRTRMIETRKLFPHLCKRCASKIDAAVEFDRKQHVKKSELAARMAKINAERRERLGTKG